MGDNMRFVPDQSYLECDKGSTVTQVKVTHNGNTKIYGEKWVTEADLIPNENIIPFGQCKAKGEACIPNPIYWDKCQENFKINGFKAVYEDACLLCKEGGKVSISFDTPTGILQNMANILKDNSHWILGLAIGNEVGMTITDKSKGYSILAANANSNLSSNSSAIIQAAKESFGENLSKLDFQAKGYDITSKAHGRSFEQGIDVAARDAKGGMDILDETKFKSGNGKPYTSSKPTASGRQGSTQWFRDRLDNALPADDAARVRGKMRGGSSDLQRVITKVEPNGTVTRYRLNPNGTTGSPVNIGAANVVKGSGKAANFINNVGRTIQANKGVAAANQWFTRNAHTISRVGKIVGRTAFVVGIISEGYNIYSAYQEEGKVGDKTKKAIGSAAGALSGGIAGAKIGAAIGTLGGPVGAAAGAIVGGAIGAIIGSGLGAKIASWF